jgi:hypothetical protein
MSDVRPVETVDKEGFVVPAPCKIEVLFGSIAWGVVVESVDDVKGALEAEGFIEVQVLEGIAVLDGVVVARRGVKEVFIFVGWWPCNSFSANIASWNK